MRFVDKLTGNGLDASDPFVVGQMLKQPERYEAQTEGAKPAPPPAKPAQPKKGGGDGKLEG
jgi:hypothetical protein